MDTEKPVERGTTIVILHHQHIHMSMQNESPTYPEQDEEKPVTQPDLHADEDGRNREWEDRARVNLENVPEGTHTNIERDFEAEPDTRVKKNPNDNTVY